MQFQNKNNDNNQDNKNDPEQQNPQPDWQRLIWPAVLIILTGWIVLQFFDNANSNTNIENITYDVLVEQAQRGNISEITIREQNASGKFISSVEANSIDSITEFSTYLPEDYNNLLETLENTPLIGTGGLSDTAVIDIQPPQDASIFIYILQFAPLILIIGFLVWMARRTQRQMNGAFGFGRTQAREYNIERPQITFEDVAGQEAAKKELVEIVDFLKEPDKYIALGARIPRGVLLIGPPGTGKTLLARAVAGEANVSFFSIAASEFVEMFVGVGASRVRDLFKRAKENSPSIVFIDEIDAVGRQRGAGLGGGHDEREQTLNQLLAEMDGFDRTESVIVMAATNRNDVLDPALLRPGRFDRQVTVGMPGRKGRFAILKIHTRGKPLSADVKLDNLARGTIGFSGADLANLANEAALNAASRNAKKVSMRDFSNAFDRIVLGTESPPLSDPNERRVVAYHEAGHALVAALTPEADPVLKVTIVPRGQALGITAQMPNDDRRNYSTAYIMARMYVLLGGRAAEKVIIGEITTGAENDLRRVTDLAHRMVSQFGMSEAIGPLNYGDDDRQPFLGQSLSQGRSYSEETASQIDIETRKLVEGAYEHTMKLLSENRDKLEALAEALLTHEIIEQDEMLRVIGMSVEETDNEAGSLSESSKSAGHFSLGAETSEESPSPQNGNGSKPKSTPSTNESDDTSDRESDPDYNPFVE